MCHGKLVTEMTVMGEHGFRMKPAGDRCITIQFKQEISMDIHRRVMALARYLTDQKVKGIEEWVPAYTSLLIYYDPLFLSYHQLESIIHKALTSEVVKEISAVHGDDHMQRIIEIPVLYGGELGPDLADVASLNGLTVEDVIRIHSSADYPVYMLGFTPGFPYLGGLDQRLHTPRLENPRPLVPAGSVGIAGQQTGIYSLSTPGGWRIIGHTPLPLFRPDDPHQPFLLRPGDLIRFRSVSREEYELEAEKWKRSEG